MMMTITTHADLHAPLPGVENFDEQESAGTQQQQEQPDVVVPSLVTDKHDDLDDGILCYECFTLFFQFGLAFLRNGNGSDNKMSSAAALSWSNVSFSILFMTATIWLYRGACADSKLDRRHYYMLLVVLPEILVSIILVLALFDKVAMAYAAVLLGGLLLAILSFVATVHFILCNKGQEQYDDDNEDDDKEISADDSVDAFIIV